MLLPGININSYNFNSLYQRIKICDNVNFFNHINNQNCDDICISTDGEWRELSATEYRVISPKKITPSLTNVSIVKLSKKLVYQYEQLNFKSCLNISDICKVENSEDFKATLEKTHSYLSKFNRNIDSKYTHNIFFGKPNLKHTTFDREKRQFIGLHLDNWEKDPINLKHRSKNRICINLGLEPRYLMFYNIGIDKMAELIGCQNLEEISHDVNYIFQNFVHKYQNYPVFRIQINPYEAYIAPTEYLIHDGSTLNTKYPDINLVIRGEFIYKPNLIEKFIQKVI
jgi:hypothetical protein